MEFNEMMGVADDLRAEFSESFDTLARKAALHPDSLIVAAFDKAYCDSIGIMFSPEWVDYHELGEVIEGAVRQYLIDNCQWVGEADSIPE